MPIACHRCQGTNPPFTTRINSSDQTKTYSCARCDAELLAQSVSSLDKIDQLITEVEASIDSAQAMLPFDTEGPPVGLEGLAITPRTIHRSLQLHLAELKIRRHELLSQLDDQSRIRRELSQAIESEDFETAAKLKNRLAELDGDDSSSNSLS